MRTNVCLKQLSVRALSEFAMLLAQTSQEKNNTTMERQKDEMNARTDTTRQRTDNRQTDRKNGIVTERQIMKENTKDKGRATDGRSNKETKICH